MNSKTLILDTHTLAWFLEDNKRLPQKRKEEIMDDGLLKIVPLIALCELHNMYRRKKFLSTVPQVYKKLVDSDNFEITGHNVSQLSFLQDDLDIHDSLIVATALEYKKKGYSDVEIISRDVQMKKFSPIPVIWD